MKVPFSQRIGSGSYTQTDFVFNAMSIDSLGATAGNLALTTYHAGSGGVLATGQVDGKTHCWVAGNGPSNGFIFRDGVKQTLATSTRISTFTSAAQKLRIGNIADDSTATYPCDDPVYFVVIWDRLLSEAEASAVSANPWQILRQSTNIALLKALATGGTLSAVAIGASEVSAVTNPATQVALAGVGVSVGTGSAQTAVVFPLSSAAIGISSGGANATATVTLSATGLAQAAATAGLSASVLIAAAAAAESSGNAALAAQLQLMAAGTAQSSGTANLTVGAAGSLAAQGGAVADGQAVLSVTIGLSTTGSAESSGAATGQLMSQGQAMASGQASAGGSAVVEVTASITAAGFVQAMGAGYLLVDIPLSALGTANASGYAYVSQAGSNHYYQVDVDIALAAKVAVGHRLASTIQAEVSLV